MKQNCCSPLLRKRFSLLLIHKQIGLKRSLFTEISINLFSVLGAAPATMLIIVMNEKYKMINCFLFCLYVTLRPFMEEFLLLFYYFWISQDVTWCHFNKVLTFFKYWFDIDWLKRKPREKFRETKQIFTIIPKACQKRKSIFIKTLA